MSNTPRERALVLLSGAKDLAQRVTEAIDVVDPNAEDLTNLAKCYKDLALTLNATAKVIKHTNH